VNVLRIRGCILVPSCPDLNVDNVFRNVGCHLISAEAKVTLRVETCHLLILNDRDYDLSCLFQKALLTLDYSLVPMLK
jgi:hypothetical protein